MDSSSIMSFNNDSTYQTTLKGEYNNVTSVHELALHAMRDRCLLLQKRINALENDNMRLKLDITKASDNSPYIPLQDDEKIKLQQKIAELSKQKTQMMHHVFMVSCENKNLWSKISTLKGTAKTKDLTKQPLIRTNTYIQSTPKTSSNYQEKYNESSLEEISLKLINSYIQEKSQLVEQYEQMAQLQDDEEILNVDSIGFTYMEDPAMDSLKEIHNQTEKLMHLKEELAQQERDLKIVLEKIEVLVQDGYKCPSCASNSHKIISSEHKEIETSDSLGIWATPVESNNYNLNTTAYKKQNENLKENEEDAFDQVCPMCGQTFSKDVVFTEFQSHVESHFIGENEPDSIDNGEIENSFQNVI